MGFLSKLRAKIGKSIDHVTEEINNKINQDEPAEIIHEQINHTDIDSQDEKILFNDFHKDEDKNEFQDIANQFIEEEVEILSTDYDINNEESILEQKNDVIIEENEPISSLNLTEDKSIDENDTNTEKKGFFSKITEALKFTKIQDGLTKTRRTFLTGFASIFGTGRKIDSQLINEFEELLITSDIGVETTDYIIDELKKRVKEAGFENAEDCYQIVKSILYDILLKSPSAENDKLFNINESNKPHTILVVGVNGVGKTTTIGKLAYNYKVAGKEVVIGAADTFRAAANEQLEIWAQRADVQIVQQGIGADPAAVAFDTLKSAMAKDKDVVIIDTAGRLHNKNNLMAELEKISRVLKKLKEDIPNEVYLVLDATTGQNAIIQAKEFSKVTPITGIILTKLDGTAKGGVVIPIAHTLKIPVRYIGVGEKIDDLMPFDPAYFIEGMFTITDEDIKQIEG